MENRMRIEREPKSDSRRVATPESQQNFDSVLAFLDESSYIIVDFPYFVTKQAAPPKTWAPVCYYT